MKTNDDMFVVRYKINDKQTITLHYADEETYNKEVELGKKLDRELYTNWLYKSGVDPYEEVEK